MHRSEARLHERPDDLYALIQLSWIDVALQRNSEAFSKVARQVAELMPPEKDAVEGPEILAGLAEIEARTGQTSEAVKTPDRCFCFAETVVSIQRLKIDMRGRSAQAASAPRWWWHDATVAEVRVASARRFTSGLSARHAAYADTGPTPGAGGSSRLPPRTNPSPSRR